MIEWMRTRNRPAPAGIKVLLTDGINVYEGTYDKHTDLFVVVQDGIKKSVPTPLYWMPYPIPPSKSFPDFTEQQIDWICYQIGEWYLGMKQLLEGQHNLGFMKEELKMMICQKDCST